MSTCTDTMLLPPFSDENRIRCELPAEPHDIHTATDPDGIVRRWPAAPGPARSAAGAT